MKSINRNQTQLRTLFFGLLCVVAGVMCFAQGFSHGSAEPTVSQSTSERQGVSPPSAFLRDAVTPQFASITPRYVTKRIADIEIGEDVVSRDPQSGEVTTKRVANVFRRVSDHLRILKVRNPETDELQTIETTNEHPFWVTARGDWIKAKDLNIGDQLDDVDGGQAILESTEYESQSNGIPVFNFEVEDFHNYYVRAHGSRGPPVLVHNADGYDILQTQILNATSPGINGHPGTGVFGDGISANFGSQKPQLLLSGPSQIEINRVRGNSFQDQVTAALSANRNAAGVSQISSRVTTIPDLPIGGRFDVTDIKDEIRLSRTTQLVSQNSAARTMGVPQNLIISPRTAQISGPLRNMIFRSGGRIFEFNPSTSTFSEITAANFSGRSPRIIRTP